MKTLIKSTLLLLLAMTLTGCGSDVSSISDDDDLVYRDGIAYKKFTDVPFSGKVTGTSNGLMKNGKKEGAWISYYSDGQLMFKGNYKNGVKEGAYAIYHPDGRLSKKWSGTFKNGVKISD